MTPGHSRPATEPPGNTERAITLEGRETFLYAGDMQYARTARHQWRDSLEKIRDAGCNAILTYVPWNWHEPREGEWDWTGASAAERDLPGFLDEVAATGLHVVLRPGPFITAEWLHGGIPSWLIDEHPEILALDATGHDHRDLDYPPITYLHPTYERYVRRFLESLLPVIREYLATNGGPIIGVQVEDEPSYWQGLRDGNSFVDYNPVMAGSDAGPGFYQSWLERSYGSVDSLNATYRTSYPSFAEVCPPRIAPRAPSDMPVHLDWYHCKLDAIAEHCFRLYAWAVDLGVDVPIYMLFPYHTLQASSRFMEQARERGLTFLTGCECYISTQSVATFGEDHVGTIAGIHEIHKTWSRAFGTPAMNFETQAAVGFHISQGAMEALIALEIGHGLNGMSYYMIAGGDTPPGYELMYGRSYDSGSPIGGDGSVREHYGAIARVGEFISTWSDRLLPAETLQDLAIGYYEPYEATSYLGNSLEWGLRDDYEDVFLNYFGIYYHARRGPTLYTLLALSGINFGSVDLERSSVEDLLRWPQVWVPGLDFMSAAVQQVLSDYVAGGGHLVMLPSVPLLDERFDRCDILQELFGAVPDTRRNGTVLGRFTPHGTVSAPGVDAMGVADYIDTFALPDGAEIIATETRTGRPCAFRRRVGGGSATLIGFKLNYWWDAKRAHKHFVDHVFKANGGRRVASARGWELVVRERASEDGAFVFVVNPQDLHSSAVLDCVDPLTGDQTSFPRLSEGVEFSGQGGLILPLQQRVGEARIVYATSQVLTTAVTDEVLRLHLYGQPGTVGEICVQLSSAPIDVVIEGDTLDQRVETDGQLTVVYRHSTDPIWLEIRL